MVGVMAGLMANFISIGRKRARVSSSGLASALEDDDAKQPNQGGNLISALSLHEIPANTEISSPDGTK